MKWLLRLSAGLIVLVALGAAAFQPVTRYYVRQTRPHWRTAVVTLRPLATIEVGIDATCINAGRPIPGPEARFSGVRQAADDVVRFLAAAEHADPMTVQAGVWALTDKYTGADVQRHLLMRDRRGNTRGAVSDAHLAAARRLLDELGIAHHL